MFMGAEIGAIINLNIAPLSLDHRIKIISIDVKDNGIFAQAIPYNDLPMNETEKLYNLEGDLEHIRMLIRSIKKMTIYDKVDAFEFLDIEKINLKEANNNQIDQYIFTIVNAS